MIREVLSIFRKSAIRLNQSAKFLVYLSKVGVHVIKVQGIKTFFRIFIRFVKRRILRILGFYEVSLDEEYKNWIRKSLYSEKEIELKKKRITQFNLKPLISIIFPVYNVDERWLRLAIDSVIRQIYESWELCVVDDASTVSHIRPVLEEYKNADPRIRVHYSEINEHISGASNKAIEMARGEFVFLMDNDDEIEPNALYEFVKVLNEKNGEVDFIYPDEDLITPEGERVCPMFKPDWSPETILSMMYATRGFFRTSIIREIGGFRKGFEGSQDYDLVLRFAERTTGNRIHHIAQVLYHWRKIPGSTASDYNAKPYARLASKKTLEDTIVRRGIDANLEDGLTFSSFHIRRKIAGNPLVSIIIPTKDCLYHLSRCIESIESKTKAEGFSYEIIVVDNNSEDPGTIEYLHKIANKHKVVKYPYKFNYSAINNYAVDRAKGEYVLFLNNDTEVINAEWLYEMLQLAQEEYIGVVGAKLLYPDGTIQHAGVYVHKDLVATHVFRGYSADSSGYMSRIQIVSNVSAVTGACMMVKRNLFKKLGGFDAENLPVAFNDVDLCLKAIESGYRVVYTPYAVLYHHESVSIKKFRTPEESIRFDREIRYMQKKWGDSLLQDKFWNPNLMFRSDGSLVFVDAKKEI